MGRHTNPPHKSQPAQEPALPNAPQPPYDHDQTYIIDDRVERVCVQQGVCQNTGGRKLSSAFCNSIVLHIGQTNIYLAFCCYLHHQFFNHHRFRADGILIPVLRQAMSVVRQATGTPHDYKQIDPMTNELKEKGFVHLTNQSEEQLQEILNSLGAVIMTTDVVIKKESKGLVTTALGIDFHTDHHSAKYVAWYCYKQTDLGGDSLLIDAEKLFLQLPIKQQEGLKTVELFEHKIFPDDKNSYPFVEVDENGNRHFHCSLVDDLDKENSAFISFQKLVSETQPITINLKQRDILVVDNHRMFHGRTPITGSKDRYLKRYWLKN